MARKRIFPTIEVGKTYKTAVKGKERTVIGIGYDCCPDYYANKETKQVNEWHPKEPGVLFFDGKNEKRLYFSIFAQWIRNRKCTQVR